MCTFLFALSSHQLVREATQFIYIDSVQTPIKTYRSSPQQLNIYFAIEIELNEPSTPR